MWKPNWVEILGGNVHGARHQRQRRLRGRQRPPTPTHQRLLPRGPRGPLRPPRRPHRPRTRHHGRHPRRALRRRLPTGQLRLRPVRRGEQLGQGTLHRGRRAGRRHHGRDEEGGRGVRHAPGVPDHAFHGGRDGVRHGNVAGFQGPGGVSGSYHDHLQRRAFAQGVRHGRGTVQRHPVDSPIGRERRPVLRPGQRGPVRHLLPHPQTRQPLLQRSQPPHRRGHRRDHLLPPLPRTAELRPPQALREHGPLPPPPLLPRGIRPPHLPALARLPRPQRPGAHPAGVRRQEHDVRRRPAPRTLPDVRHDVPRFHVQQGGGRRDAQNGLQKFRILCRMDSQQPQGQHLRRSPRGNEDVERLHRKLHLHSGGVEEGGRAVYRHVPS
mmetsp:Transcript_41418/g.86944  ORF Transcript_41418/g.86944 Transcript_41418/m.86944 type:complete len:381 (-) Transcript_41418:499-1641(-)